MVIFPLINRLLMYHPWIFHSELIASGLHLLVLMKTDCLQEEEEEKVPSGRLKKKKKKKSKM